MKLLSKKPDTPAPAPLAGTPEEWRARLAEVETFITGWRLLAPHGAEYIRTLVDAGAWAEVDTARQRLKEGTSTELAALEIERCQLTMQIADADAQAALAARQAVQAQLAAVHEQRSALTRQLLPLLEAEHQAARQGTEAAARRIAAERDLEDWTDYLAGTTPEQRWKRRGGVGRYLGVAGKPLEAPDRARNWHGPPIKDGIIFEPQYSAERRRLAWGQAHPAPDAPAS